MSGMLNHTRELSCDKINKFSLSYVPPCGKTLKAVKFRLHYGKKNSEMFLDKQM